MTTTSSDVADEEHFFFTQADGEDQFEEQNLSWKEQFREKEMVCKSGTILNEAMYQRVHKNRRKHYVVFHQWNQRKCKNTSRAKRWSSTEESKTRKTWPTTWWSASDNGQTIQAIQSKWGTHYFQDGLLFRNYYGETGSVKYYQILITKQLVYGVLRSLHGEFGKHPGITKTIIAYREKYYYPNMAQLIREWVMTCEQCIRETRIHRSLTRRPLQNPNEYITPPEEAMQIDLVPGLPPSGGKHNIVTAMEVFSGFSFAYPTSNQDNKTFAKVINNTMTKHAYLPTTLLSDKCTAFMSHVIKDVAGVLGITLKHATTKHAQTNGLLERSYASIKQALKIETAECRSLWHKYVSIAVLNNNTSYHAGIGCETSRVFHGRVPYNILYIKMGFRPQKIPSPDSQTAQDVLEQTKIIFQDVRKNTTQAYIK